MADDARARDEVAGPLLDPEPRGEVLSGGYQAQRLAERLGIEYVDLDRFEIDPELFRSIPVDLMFRYNFVPRHRTASGLQIVVADPTDVLMIDELELLLGTGIDVAIGTALSGGLDSSATISCMVFMGNRVERRQGPSWQHAFVASFPGTHLDEVKYARQVTDHLGIDATVLVIDPVQAIG